jgi:glycosyltransferase involved in cell wall biosynthesis
MKILIDHNDPFLLAHGGLQVQITRTKSALEEAGLAVEYLRWWDDSQRGDVIHFFGRASPSHIDFAHGKGIGYVMQELLTSQGSRSVTHLRFQALINRVLCKVLPANYRLPLRWDSYRKADAIIAITDWEAWIMGELFDASSERIHVLPNAVDEVYFHSGSKPVGDYLICVATITERKRVLELAQAATFAKTPLKVVGEPYSENDPYFLRFLETVQASQQIVEYLGPIHRPEEMAARLRGARGFVLPSTMETQSLAALEAAAATLPLLLSDLPWAHATFGNRATYVPVCSGSVLSNHLRAFFNLASRLPTPPQPPQWKNVADRLARIYQSVLGKYERGKHIEKLPHTNRR